MIFACFFYIELNKQNNNEEGHVSVSSPGPVGIRGVELSWQAMIHLVRGPMSGGVGGRFTGVDDILHHLRGDGYFVAMGFARDFLGFPYKFVGWCRSLRDTYISKYFLHIYLFSHGFVHQHISIQYKFVRGLLRSS